MWDVVRDYPSHVGRVRWTDRFFYRAADGEFAPLSRVWRDDGPGIVGLFMSVVRLMGSQQMRFTLRLAMRANSEALP